MNNNSSDLNIDRIFSCKYVLLLLSMIFVSSVASAAKPLSLLIPVGLLGTGILGIKYPGFDISRNRDDNYHQRKIDQENKKKVSKILEKYKSTEDDYIDKLVSTVFKSETTEWLTKEQKNLGISAYLLSFKVESSDQTENKTLISIYDLLNGKDIEGILLYKDLWNTTDIDKVRDYKLGIGSYKYLDLGFKEFEVEKWLEKIVNACNIQIKDKKENKYSKEFNGLNKWEKAKLLIYLFIEKSRICTSRKSIAIVNGKWKNLSSTR